MTIQFKTNSIYTLGSLKLECTYIEDNTVWLISQSGLPDYYKLNRKNNKLYKLNQLFSSYDQIENTLSEYKSKDVWQERPTHRYSYDGNDQTLNYDD